MWFFFCILSVAFPCVPLIFYSRRPLRNAWLWPVLGFASAGMVCMDHFLTISRRCISGDFGGIEDTIAAVLLICAAALIASLVLGIVCLALHYVVEKGEE